MTGHACVPTAVRALKGGAVDFIQKPFSDESMIESVRRAIDLDRRSREKRIERVRHLARFAELTPKTAEAQASSAWAGE